MGGGHFGNLAKVRGIITYTLSPYEQRAFGQMMKKGVPNTLRRIWESAFVVWTPLLVGYLIYDQTEKAATRMSRKNPADYECDV